MYDFLFSVSQVFSAFKTYVCAALKRVALMG